MKQPWGEIVQMCLRGQGQSVESENTYVKMPKMGTAPLNTIMITVKKKSCSLCEIVSLYVWHVIKYAKVHSSKRKQHV